MCMLWHLAHVYSISSLLPLVGARATCGETWLHLAFFVDAAGVHTIEGAVAQRHVVEGSSKMIPGVRAHSLPSPDQRLPAISPPRRHASASLVCFNQLSEFLLFMPLCRSVYVQSQHDLRKKHPRMYVRCDHQRVEHAARCVSSYCILHV